MVALVFLYVIASIFIYGGELNAAILRWPITARHRPKRHPPRNDQTLL